MNATCWCGDAAKALAPTNCETEITFPDGEPAQFVCEAHITDGYMWLEEASARERKAAEMVQRDAHEEDSRCPVCIEHPGWAHGDESRRGEPADTCRACFGSGTRHSHTLPNGDPDDCHTTNTETVPYMGTDLAENMTLRIDGRDWNIDHVFPYAEMSANLHYSTLPRVQRDPVKSILHLSTFIPWSRGGVGRGDVHHAAYVIDNGDSFDVVS